MKNLFNKASYQSLQIYYVFTAYRLQGRIFLWNFPAVSELHVNSRSKKIFIWFFENFSYVG